jgi:hypothetical protein
MDDYETLSGCIQSEVLMTWAMCLSCGDIKGSALVPCSNCNAPATGNLALDIAFSDHRIPRETLRELGGIVRAIHRICEVDSLCFWSFLRYVSIHYPTILEIELKDDVKQDVANVLAHLEHPRMSLTHHPTEFSPAHSE